MFKYAIFLFAFILTSASLVTSCSDQTSENILEEPIASKPKITISKDLTSVEVLTDFTITIESEFVAQTSLFIDDIELRSSSDETIEYSIDPFPFDIGIHNLKIISTDTQDEKSSYNISFEIKRLLFKDETFYTKENPLQGLKYISIHTSAGALLEIREIEGPEDGIFYAENNFQKQDLIITRYEFPTLFLGFYGISSYLDVKVGTIITLNQNLESPYFFPKTALLNFNADISPELVANNYNSTIVSKNNTNYGLLYSENLSKNFLITTSPEALENIGDYRYLIVDDVTKNEYALSDFQLPADIIELGIPMDSNFRLNLYGFINQDDFIDNKFYEVYVSRNSSNKMVQVPILDEYSLYQVRLTYSLDNTDVYINHDSVYSPIESPDVEILQQQDLITITGEYEYLGLELTISTLDLANTLNWVFISSQKENITIPYVNFEIPEIISQILLDVGIKVNLNDSSNQKTFLSCNLYNNYDYNYQKDQLRIKPNYSINRNGFSVTRRLDLNY